MCFAEEFRGFVMPTWKNLRGRSERNIRIVKVVDFTITAAEKTDDDGRVYCLHCMLNVSQRYRRISSVIGNRTRVENQCPIKHKCRMLPRCSL
mmetsp:Transcript_24272/g.58587  ORF Transcript_24272/g.58587 Transcript_24272/m.58587 type:complete len:93 (-) Transcript_24272:5-283(-)